MKKLEPISLHQVTINDHFWSQRQQLVNDVVIPFQWDALNDNLPGLEPSHTIENFRIAAGDSNEEYYGMVFQDSDLGKWLETVGFALGTQRDEKLEKIADDVIDLIGRAQQPNGYLNTYFTVKHPDQRWTNLRDDHELYCAGHMIEAAVAYYESTGKRKLLDMMCKMVDHISSELGREEGKKRGYPGHPEIELALIKLYRVTLDEKHLALSEYFVNERGQSPKFFERETEIRGGKPRFFGEHYHQAHLPIREQVTAEGHSVRAAYLYSGVVDVAAEMKDHALFDAAKLLWDNVVSKRMYITGGIGSSAYGEAFTVDYDLPNDRAYTETCASIGLMFWAHRMQQIEPDRQYADVMELALYNGILSGMSLDGKNYFYVNPLEVWPSASHFRDDMNHVKTVRQGWFGCACCPPNIARLLASLGQYIYSKTISHNELYVHLYIGSRTSMEVNGVQVELEQSSGELWNENKSIQVNPSGQVHFTLSLRWPGWCRKVALSINGQSLDASTLVDSQGYIKITRTWQANDLVEIQFDMPVEVIHSHPELRENAGKIALMRGPIVYCLEEKDNGANLQDIRLSSDTNFEVEHTDLLGGIPVIKAEAKRSDLNAVNDSSLYRREKTSAVSTPIQAIPYYAWANRGENEMIVWIREE